jgi:hypothetical protein
VDVTLHHAKPRSVTPRARCSGFERTGKILRGGNNVLRSPSVLRAGVAALTVTATIPSVAAAQTIGPVQTAVDTNPGKVSLVASYEFTNAYMFRGLRQDDTRVIMFPFAEARIDLYDDDEGLTNVALRIGSWNSLNTGVSGSAGPSGKLWYESRFYSAVDFTLGPGIIVGGGYTAYPSPNNSFSTVKELFFRASADERNTYGGLALRPHALLAMEFDTEPAVGQADGGLGAGTYLELGIYELAGVDHNFGYLSLGAIASLPLARTTTYGAWDVHGGVEFQSLGDTPEAFNGGDQSKVIGTIGIGFSY